MNVIQNWEELLFIKQNGRSFGFGGLEVHHTKPKGQFNNITEVFVYKIKILSDWR